MINDNTEDFQRLILEFHKEIQSMVDSSLACYESFLRDEDAVKILNERLGEIPNIQRPDNEHKADA
jgi:hypothetical protein